MNSQIEDKSESSKPRFIFEENNDFIKREASTDEDLHSYPIVKTVKTEQNEARQNENNHPHFPTEADLKFKLDIQSKILQAPETTEVTKHYTTASENDGNSDIPDLIKNEFPIIKTVKTELNEARQDENNHPHFPIEADFNFKVEIQANVLQAPETAEVTKHFTIASENDGNSAIPYPIKNEFPIETKTVKVEIENFEPIIKNIEIDTIKSEENETNPSMLLPRDDNLSCNYCEFETKDLTKLATHRNECCYKIPYAIQTVNKVKSVKQVLVACDHCEYQTSSKRRLIVHIHSRHMQKEGIPRKRRRRLQTELKYPCCFCDAKFTTLLKRKEHIKTHSKRKSHRTIKKMWLHVDRSNQRSEKMPTCNLCTRKFCSPKGFNEHYKNVHGKNMIEFICDNCRDSFPQKSQIIMHLKAKICEGGEFTANADADICDYDMYLAKDTAKKYLIRKTAARTAEYTCHECSFKCEYLISLKEHMRVHCVKRRHKKSAKQYSCQFCKFKSLSENILNEHILKVHENEKPYFCKLCDSKYSLMNNLVKHIRSHFNRK